MNTIASRDQFKPMRIGENLVVPKITITAHSARPPKIPGWIVVVREIFFCKQAGFAGNKQLKLY